MTEATPSDVLLVGTGTMGTALAKAILSTGAATTVWNRTKARTRQVAESGARVAVDLAEAVSLASVVLVCVSDQAAARGLLEVEPVAQALRGKVFVQLTTGTPADGRRNEAWAKTRGIRYLDVAIMAYPREIGTDSAVLLFAGDRSAFDENVAIFNTIGAARFLGEDAGAPALLDAALIGFFYGSLVGFIHGLALVKAEGADVAGYVELAKPFLAGFIANAVLETAERTISGDLSEPQSSMDTHLGGIDLLVVGSSEQAGIRTGVVRAIRDSFREAVTGGHGAEDIAVLVDTWTRAAGEHAGESG